MKTISGQPISSKQISLSKAAKILSKFVSAENGASQVIRAYLHRASASFNELNQLHKELKSSRSHQKHKRHRTETCDERGRVVESSIPTVETNQELKHGPVKSQNNFRWHQFGSEDTNEDGEKSTQTVVKISQEPNGTMGYYAGNVGGSGSEKHKKNKKKQEVESTSHGDSRVEFGEREDEGNLPTRAQNEILFGRELRDEGEGNTELEEGKKQKREKNKKKKKEEEGTCNVSCNKSKAENPEGESVMRSEHQKEIEKKLCNSVESENEGLVEPQDLQIKKEKKYDAGSENKLYAEVVKMIEKKRKNEEVEGRVEDRSGDQTKRKKRKREEAH